MSTGHGRPVRPSFATPSATSVPGIDSVPLNGDRTAVSPYGTAPGCHVTVARPSLVTTAPAAPGTAVSDPVTGAGSGAAATCAVAPVVTAVEPPLPVAVTRTEIVEPMSPGVTVYVEAVAP